MLVLPGEVIWLEIVSQLFAAVILFLSALFTFLPVGSSRDVQHRLAGQHLPVHNSFHQRLIKLFILPSNFKNAFVFTHASKLVVVEDKFVHQYYLFQTVGKTDALSGALFGKIKYRMTGGLYNHVTIYQFLIHQKSRKSYLDALFISYLPNCRGKFF